MDQRKLMDNANTITDMAKVNLSRVQPRFPSKFVSGIIFTENIWFCHHMFYLHVYVRVYAVFCIEDNMNTIVFS